MKTCNRASEVELWDVHRELKMAMTELITNRNYASAAEILRHVDRRMAGLLNALTLVPERPNDIAFVQSASINQKSEIR